MPTISTPTPTPSTTPGSSVGPSHTSVAPVLPPAGPNQVQEVFRALTENFMPGPHGLSPVMFPSAHSSGLSPAAQLGLGLLGAALSGQLFGPAAGAMVLGAAALYAIYRMAQSRPHP
jgi:hypothetical protein